MAHPLRTLSLSAACLAASCFASQATAQGAIKPVEAVIVNPATRPVPVSDKSLLEAANAILTATRALAPSSAPTPYQATIIFNQSPTRCSNWQCTATTWLR